VSESPRQDKRATDPAKLRQSEVRDFWFRKRDGSVDDIQRFFAAPLWGLFLFYIVTGGLHYRLISFSPPGYSRLNCEMPFF
jgi:hypothetical protein